MPVYCYTIVSDLAVCQRCPALFAYIIYMKEKSAWRVGIRGGEELCGSVFHKEIAEKFFEAASDKHHSLNEAIMTAASKGVEALEGLVQENFFVPFIETKSKYFTSKQILSMARAAKIWINHMAVFLENSRLIFMKPEGKLEGCYFSKEHDAILFIRGRYDALVFNSKSGEARLFEFKGFKKSDITVSLSQSLIYSWLIEKSSGIIPSIEIIYLDEKKPEIFAPEIVKEMIISGLPGLFNTALDIMLLRRMPNMFQDKKLCEGCKFKTNCKKDMEKIFSPVHKKRRGASLLTLLVFFFAAVMVTSQVFFFSNITAEAVKDDREVLGVRLQLASLVESARKAINTNAAQFNVDYSNVKYQEKGTNFETFWNDTRKDINDSSKGYFYTENFFYKNEGTEIYASVHDLNYKYDPSIVYGKFDDKFIETTKNAYRKIFPPIPGHYLIRAYTKYSDSNKKNLMLQVLVDSDGKIKTYEEIWY